jgi:MFS family permease
MHGDHRVGIAQMITQLPALVLLLVAGFVADRYEQRKILIVTHLLVALSQLSMAWLICVGALTFNSLLALALLGAVAGTFSGPPRDAMLSHVAGARIQHTVILVIGLQFARR